MILLLALFFTVFIVAFCLYKLPWQAVIYPSVVCLVFGIIYLICDFLRELKIHKKLTRIKEINDIADIDMSECGDGLCDDYKEIVRLISDEHRTYQTICDGKYSDMIGYYTLWVHQIKTPISSMKLRLQGDDSNQARLLLADLHRIEQYVEMVLTFLRLNSDGSDFVFREYDLDDIIKQAIRNFAGEFIIRQISIDYTPCNSKVITDEKWLLFVIEQVISNSLKYTKSGSVSIYLDTDMQLKIVDTGIGIDSRDLPRIFENGFTGFNGRSDKKASGIGLYLCKSVCDALGHTINIKSEIGLGTTVCIGLLRQKLEIE